MPVRRATMSDLIAMQHCNLVCLPENYQMKYYLYHGLTWSQLLYVHEDFNGKVTGYVMAKMEDEDEEKDEKIVHGHITSIAVLKSHRKLGIASSLVRSSAKDVEEVFPGEYFSLHVRCTNEGAIHLYQDTLGFRIHGIEDKYYADDEDAYEMKWWFKRENPGAYVTKVSRTQRHTGCLKWPVSKEYCDRESKRKTGDPKESESDGARDAAAAAAAAQRRARNRGKKR